MQLCLKSPALISGAFVHCILYSLSFSAPSSLSAALYPFSPSFFPPPSLPPTTYLLSHSLKAHCFCLILLTFFVHSSSLQFAYFIWARTKQHQQIIKLFCHLRRRQFVLCRHLPNCPRGIHQIRWPRNHFFNFTVAFTLSGANIAWTQSANFQRHILKKEVNPNFEQTSKIIKPAAGNTV